jgi:hypothetical protein
MALTEGISIFSGSGFFLQGARSLATHGASPLARGFTTIQLLDHVFWTPAGRTSTAHAACTGSEPRMLSLRDVIALMLLPVSALGGLFGAGRAEASWLIAALCFVLGLIVGVAVCAVWYKLSDVAYSLDRHSPRAAAWAMLLFCLLGGALIPGVFVATSLFTEWVARIAG